MYGLNICVYVNEHIVSRSISTCDSYLVIPYCTLTVLPSTVHPKHLRNRYNLSA